MFHDLQALVLVGSEVKKLLRNVSQDALVFSDVQILDCPSTGQNVNARPAQLEKVRSTYRNLRIAVTSKDNSSHKLSGPFNLFGEGIEVVNGTVKIRPEQQSFRRAAFRRYGKRCAVCELTHEIALDAAHICPMGKQGSNDPGNAIVLCASHHRMFDHGLFNFEPDTHVVALHHSVSSHGDLGIRRTSLEHLPCQPHNDALIWRKNQWLKLR
jgi:HNH endonuclease